MKISLGKAKHQHVIDVLQCGIRCASYTRIDYNNIYNYVMRSLFRATKPI